MRPERHVPTSIATAYELLARALLQRLPCRSCGAGARLMLCNTVVLGGRLLDQGAEEVAGGGSAPVARALDTADQPALAID